MTWVDYGILAVIGLSALVSFLRGFMREALSLVTWALAFWVGLTFAVPLAHLFSDYLVNPTVRLVAAFVVLFLTTLLLGGAVNYLVARLVDKTGLSGTDRTVGVVFGVLRGGLLVAGLVLLAGFTRVPSAPWWQQSALVEQFVPVAVWLAEFLPPGVADEVRFSNEPTAP